LVTASAGSYAVTGSAAAIKAGRAVAAGSGSYAVTGSSVGLITSHRVAANAGSYALTGANASINKSAGDKTLSGDAGSYVLTGAAVTLLVSRRVAANSGSYALTGTAATISASTVVEAPTGYVNATVTRPRHERIGRPLPPQLFVPPQPIDATASSGQGNQSASGRCDISVESVAASANVSSTKATGRVGLAAEGAAVQKQASQFSGGTKMTISLRAAQSSDGAGFGTAQMSAIVKSGGESLIQPTYSGDDLRFEDGDEVFDRAA
jgi:hypothetical protein